MRQSFVFIIFMSIVLLFMPFCMQGTVQAEDESSLLRVGWTRDLDSLSPFISNRIATYETLLLLYDSLFAYDNDANPVGRLAKEWTVSEDHLTWTIKLVEGVKWHDGEPLTSADVKWTYENLIKAQTGMYASVLQGITSIEAPDPLTVLIKSDKPKANLMDAASPILPKHIWEKVKFGDLSTWPNDKPIGTGAFKLVEWKKGEYIKFEANKDYFLGAPKINQLVISHYANNDTLAQSLKIGEIDAAVGINSNQVKLLQEAKDIQVLSNPGTHFNHMAINVWNNPKSKGNPLLLNRELRQAMEYAINKKLIIDIAYSGQAVEGTSLMPSSLPTWHYEPQGEELRSFNPEKAISMLESAGFNDSDGDGIREDANGNKLQFRLYLRGSAADEVRAGQMISADLKSVGIGTKIETVDDGVIYDKIYDNVDFDLFLWGWGVDIDPTTILSVVSTKQIGKLSQTNYSNPAYDKMMEEQQTIVDQPTRVKMVKDMQKMVYADVPYIVLLEDNRLQAIRTEKWEGMTPVGGGLFLGYNHYNYLHIGPKKAAVEATASDTTTAATTTDTATAELKTESSQQTGSYSGLVWGGLIIVVIVVVGVIVAKKRNKTIDDFE